ncbi:MAG: Maf family nucleotide pyrophosphatase [Planctomycetota bacterium]
MNFKQPQIILASGSSQRSALLKMCYIPHRVIISRIKEKTAVKGNPAELVIRNAYNKANSVAYKLKTGLVIGADSIAYAGNRVIGKLKTGTPLIKILKFISGRVSFIYTGLALIDVKNQRCVMGYARTAVKMKRPSEPELIRWAKVLGFRSDCAGGFSIDGPGAVLIPHIEGCYFNILGMPISKLAELFNGLGYNMLDFIKK